MLECCMIFFFFNDTATTEIYTLSLHDALPIYRLSQQPRGSRGGLQSDPWFWPEGARGDRKSTRLNSSHSQISYAVFCLKKKNISQSNTRNRRTYTSDCPLPQNISSYTMSHYRY